MSDTANLKCCGTCAFWEPLWEGDDDEEALGGCNWQTPLPYAWRYCRREVVGVYRYHGTKCPTYTPKPLET